MMIKTVTVNSYSDNMKGIVTINNQSYEIPNVTKDELIEVEYEPKNQKKPVNLKRIIKANPNRINPECKYAAACGGCNFNYINYLEESIIKKEWISNLYKKLKYNREISLITMDNPHFYRNKCQAALKMEKNNLVAGFYEEGTHKIINVDKCLIQDQKITEIQQKIQKILIKNHYQAYDEDKKKGIFRHILVKRSNSTNEVLVVLVTAIDNFPGKNNLAKILIKEIKEITSIIQNVNPRQTSAVLGEKEYILYGPGFIFDIMDGYKFKITSKSFYQVNSKQTTKLYSKAIEFAKLNKKDILLDAYSGVGTIGIFASKNVKQVISVELNKDAVKNAIQNAKYNKIENIKFYQNDATNYILKAAADKEHIDVVIMDPPRTGSTKEFINALITLKPKKIIYISCNPLTQIIDLKGLLNNYSLDNVLAVDMFPRTANIEVIALLKLK